MGGCRLPLARWTDCFVDFVTSSRRHLSFTLLGATQLKEALYTLQVAKSRDSSKNKCSVSIAAYKLPEAAHKLAAHNATIDTLVECKKSLAPFQVFAFHCRPTFFSLLLLHRKTSPLIETNEVALLLDLTRHKLLPKVQSLAGAFVGVDRANCIQHQPISKISVRFGTERSLLNRLKTASSDIQTNSNKAFPNQQTLISTSYQKVADNLKRFLLASGRSSFSEAANLLPGQHRSFHNTSMQPLEDWQVEKDYREPMRSALEFLETFKNYERKGVPKGAGTDSEQGFPLRRMELLMERLGSPEAHLKAVHVAGTKGKGSVVAMLAALLQRAKLKVGTYTSPHFLTVRERFVINGRPISPEAFPALVAAHRPLLEELRDTAGVSHFEVLTALAFKHFEAEKVDVAIIETGLGGARDATNVIPPEALLLAIITPIYEEHKEALGGSLESIVRAKCGIIKEGRPVLLAHQSPAHLLTILPIVEFFARQKNAPLLHVEPPLGCADARPLSRDPVRNGRRENFLTASQAARFLLQEVFRLPESAPLGDCEEADLMGNLLGREELLSGPETERLGLPGKSVLLDGAHTPESFQGLCRTLSDAAKKQPGNGRVLFVVAMSNDKDATACLKQLCTGSLDLRPPIFTEVSVAGSFERSKPAAELGQTWASLVQHKEPAVCEPDFEKALKRAAEAPDGTLVCFTGSMHIVGAALARVAAIKERIKRGV